MSDAPEVDEGDALAALRWREDEEAEFYTELALHETERWIQVDNFKFLFPLTFLR